jgi:hypothetical protein
MKVIEAYRETFKRSWLISLVPLSFLLLLSLLSTYRVINALQANPSFAREYPNEAAFAVAIHLILDLIIISQLILLVGRKYFWIEQAIWLLSLITIFGWSAFTLRSPLGLFTPLTPLCYDCYTTPFLGAGDNLSIALILLLMLSPIRRLVTLAISLVRVKGRLP